MPRKTTNFRNRVKKLDLRKGGEKERHRLLSMSLPDRLQELYTKQIKGKAKIEDRKNKLTRFVHKNKAEKLLKQGLIAFDKKREVYYV